MKAEQLLGTVPATLGPEPRAGPSGHDDGVEHGGIVLDEEWWSAVDHEADAGVEVFGRSESVEGLVNSQFNVIISNDNGISLKLTN